MVRIVWNGMGGELDSVTVEDDGDRAIANALMDMISGTIVTAGDSFTIQEVA